MIEITVNSAIATDALRKFLIHRLRASMLIRKGLSTNGHEWTRIRGDNRAAIVGQRIKNGDKNGVGDRFYL